MDAPLQNHSATVPLLIDGEWRTSANTFDSVDPYRDDIVSSAVNTSDDEINDAIDAARRASSEVAAMPAYDRAALLRRVGVLIAERFDEIGTIMACLQRSGRAFGEISLSR